MRGGRGNNPRRSLKTEGREREEKEERENMSKRRRPDGKNRKGSQEEKQKNAMEREARAGGGGGTHGRSSPVDKGEAGRFGGGKITKGRKERRI